MKKMMIGLLLFGTLAQAQTQLKEISVRLPLLSEMTAILTAESVLTFKGSGYVEILYPHLELNFSYEASNRLAILGGIAEGPYICRRFGYGEMLGEEYFQRKENAPFGALWYTNDWKDDRAMLIMSKDNCSTESLMIKSLKCKIQE